MLTTYKTILSQRTQLSSDVYLYHFDLIEPKEILFTAGQYLTIKIPTEKYVASRFYSIASPTDKKGTLSFIIQIFPGGLASNLLSSLKIGDELILYGPTGTFNLKETNRHKVFLATGTGIAPIISILDSSQLPLSEYRLFWGVKTYADVYLFDKIKKFNPIICLSREKNLEMIPESDHRYFNLSHVDVAMEKQVGKSDGQISANEFYLCGGAEVVESLRQGLLAKNIPRENIFFEKFL